MPCQSEKQARAEAMLGELAELGLMVARELAVRTRESEDVEQTVALADTFQKVSRVVRLTLALEFKLDRDAARAAREAEQIVAETARADAARAALAPRPARAPTAAEARKERVGKLLHRLLWNESEGDTEEFDILQEDLRVRLDEAALNDDFATLPVEAIARRIVADMGLSGELTLSLGEAPAGDVQASRGPPLADTG